MMNVVIITKFNHKEKNNLFNLLMNKQKNLNRKKKNSQNYLVQKLGGLKKPANFFLCGIDILLAWLV